MMPYRKKSDVEALLREVREIYAMLEQVPIERDCIRRTECCYFTRTGLTPQLTAGEGVLAAKAWRASGRKEIKPRADGGCPMLIGDLGKGKCAIYADRPFGCRTHFCEAAGGHYARRDVVELIRRLEAIDNAFGGKGPKSLAASIEEGMQWKGV